MALLIRNGEIVTVGSRVHADIYVEKETITRIGANLSIHRDNVPRNTPNTRKETEALNLSWVSWVSRTKILDCDSHPWA